MAQSAFTTPMGGRTGTPRGGGGNMNVGVGMQSTLAMSAPVGSGGGGATTRAASVRRRLMLPDVNVSPKSKRPPAYVQPGETPLVPKYDQRKLTNEVIQQKHAIEAIHVWVQGIADAVDHHATALDGQDVVMGHVKGKLARYEQTMSKGLLGAEEQLTETFAKQDSLVGQLRADSTTTTAALAARATQLEEDGGPPSADPTWATTASRTTTARWDCRRRSR